MSAHEEYPDFFGDSPLYSENKIIEKNRNIALNSNLEKTKKIRYNKEIELAVAAVRNGNSISNEKVNAKTKANVINLRNKLIANILNVNNIIILLDFD